MINSINAKRINPPSSTGIGRRFIIKREILIMPISENILIIPVLKLSLKLSFTVVPSKSVTRAGPETALSKLTPLKSVPILLNVNEIYSTVSRNPWARAEKIFIFEVDFFIKV